MHAHLRDLEHELLVRDLLLLHLRHLLLQTADEVEVVVRDVVVVVLDLAEGLLVLLHQLVDVVVLALLDLKDLHLAAQLEVVAEQLHLALIPAEQIAAGGGTRRRAARARRPSHGRPSPPRPPPSFRGGGRGFARRSPRAHFI